MKNMGSSLKKNLIENGIYNLKGYANSYLDNIYKNTMPQKYQDMFEEGSGGELHSKAEAVHSSSMLAYNFFHWISNENPFILEQVRYTEVFFEVKMKTLACVRGRPANMDVVLKGEKDGKTYLLFIESKFLEFFENVDFELSDAYSNPDNWIRKNINWKEIIGKTKELVKNSSCKYKGGIKQAITHLFGIQGLYDKKSFEKSDLRKYNIVDDISTVEVAFLNVVFQPDSHRFKNEYDKYCEYNSLYNDFIELMQVYNVIQPRWVSYSSIWTVMKKQIKDVEFVRYIENRYLNFSENLNCIK